MGRGRGCWSSRTPAERGKRSARWATGWPAWAVADDPSSPHLSADRITAAVYVAGAIEDGSFTAEQAGLLDRALTGAGVEHTVEFYPARHGFAVPDNPTYDAAAEARHWEALGRLYRDHLGG
jgi:carboxymethylenebutenolidase